MDTDRLGYFGCRSEIDFHQQRSPLLFSKSVSICVHLWFLLLLLIPNARAADADTAFKEATVAYKAGEFQKAMDDFRKIAADEQQLSAALCHNIANCAYRLGEAADGDTVERKKEAAAHYGQAAVWYRRALALDPALPEALQNLRFLERKSGLHRFEPAGLAKFGGRFHHWKWKTALHVSIWTAVLAVIWLAWATPREGRRWPLVTVLSLAIGIIVTTALGLYGKASDPAPLSKRIFNTQSPAWLRTAPAEAAATVIELYPGSEMLPVREEGNWTYCQMPASEGAEPIRGWIRTIQTEKLWPWPAALVE